MSQNIIFLQVFFFFPISRFINEIPSFFPTFRLGHGLIHAALPLCSVIQGVTKEQECDLDLASQADV